MMNSQSHPKIVDFVRRKARNCADSFMSELRRYKEEEGSSVWSEEELGKIFTNEFMSCITHPLFELPSNLPTSPGLPTKKRWSNFWHFKKNKGNSDDKDFKDKLELPKRSMTMDALMFEPQVEGNSKQILYQGTVKMLNPANQMDKSRLQWQACRLVLVKQFDMSNIEMYSPPKATCPKSSIFGFNIEEVRKATSLEMPTSSTTFVIKAEFVELLFDPDDSELTAQWIDKIKTHCIQAKTKDPSKIKTGRTAMPLPTVPDSPSHSDQDSSQLLSPRLLPSCERDGMTAAMPQGKHSDAADVKCRVKCQRDNITTSSLSYGRSLSNGNRRDSSIHSNEDATSQHSLSPTTAVAKSKTLPLGAGAIRCGPQEETPKRKLSLPSTASNPSQFHGMNSKMSSMSCLPQSHSSAPQSCLKIPDRIGLKAPSVDREDVTNGSEADFVDIEAIKAEMAVRGTLPSQSVTPVEHDPMNGSNGLLDISPDNGSLFSSDLELEQDQPHSRSRQSPNSPTDPFSDMVNHPWYHGLLLRADCSRLIQSLGPDATGVYLVRKSESVGGDYVLSFSYQGRAKHLRMKVNSDGSCSMQHLTFPTVSEMLDHFTRNPIPLESTFAFGDIKLTTYLPSSESGDIRAEYNAFQQARSNPRLRGRAQSFSMGMQEPRLQLRVNGQPVNRAVEHIYVYT